jgi:hypothetical protein
MSGTSYCPRSGLGLGLRKPSIARQAMLASLRGRASGRVRRVNRPDTRLLLTTAKISFKYVLLCSGYPHRTFVVLQQFGQNGLGAAVRRHLDQWQLCAGSDLCKVSPIPRQRPFVWRAAKVGSEPIWPTCCGAAIFFLREFIDCSLCLGRSVAISNWLSQKMG